MVLREGRSCALPWLSRASGAGRVCDGEASRSPDATLSRRQTGVVFGPEPIREQPGSNRGSLSNSGSSL